MTLLEIIAVLLIIAVLAAGSMALFGGNSAKAQNASAQSNLKNVSVMLASVATEGGGNWKNYPSGAEIVTELEQSGDGEEFTFLGNGAQSTEKKQVSVEKENNTLLKIHALSDSGFFVCAMLPSKKQPAFGTGATTSECYAAARSGSSAFNAYSMCGQNAGESSIAVSWALTRMTWESSTNLMYLPPHTNPSDHENKSGDGYWTSGDNYTGPGSALDDSGNDFGGWLNEFNGNCNDVQLVNANGNKYPSRNLIDSASPLTSEKITVAYYLWSGDPLTNPIKDKFNRATFVVNDSKGKYYCATWRGDGSPHYGIVDSASIAQMKSASEQDPAVTRPSGTFLDSAPACNQRDFDYDDDGSGGTWTSAW